MLNTLRGGTEMVKSTFVGCVAVLVFLSVLVGAAADFSGSGFSDHGIAAPVSFSRGTIATVDSAGRDVVLVWLYDRRGGYSLLMIDAATGEAAQYAVPFTPDDGPYASLLSSGNKCYTLFNSHFVEFDVNKRAFTFDHQTTPQMATSLTEDDNGVIWAVTYPQSGVVSYDPKTGDFRDYGQAYRQNWQEYPNHIAADNKGWVYFGISGVATQIIAFDPVTGKAFPMIPESERRSGGALVYRDIDGSVYGKAVENGHGGMV